MSSENESCAECGKEVSGSCYRRGGKAFCSGHCEIEDWWDDPSPQNAGVQL